MRGWLGAVGGLVMAGGLLLGFRLLHRPPLRVALELEAGNADDAAIAAGVALAIEERDGRAGPWRVSATNQIRHPNGPIEFPEPRAHTILHGLKAPAHVQGPAGPLLTVNSVEEGNLIRAWMRKRGLERLSPFDPHTWLSSGPYPPGDFEKERVPELLKDKPDVVVMRSFLGCGKKMSKRFGPPDSADPCSSI